MAEKITLKEPVTVAGQEYKTLELRSPKVRDMITANKAAKDDANREVALFANLCEVEPAVIEELSLADYRRLQEAYQGFLS